MIIIDINLGDKNGFDFASELKKVNNKVLLAFVTGHGNQLNLRNQAKTFGADGFFLKDPKPEKFLLQIKKALSGKKPGIELELKLPRLTSREEKVLHYLCRGYSNQELAERLFVSSRQIERHKRNLTIKFNVSNDKTLVRKAIDLGYEIIY